MYIYPFFGYISDAIGQNLKSSEESLFKLVPLCEGSLPNM